MMSPSHAFSGAYSGYLSCIVASAVTGHQWSWWYPHVVAVICAGWALWPDCDTLRSTVSTSLGWITQGLHHFITIVASAVYYATRTDADPPDKPVIHRGITHTWPGAVFMGVVVTIPCLIWPHYAAAVVLAISLHWGLRGLAIPKAPHGKPRGNFMGRFLTERGYMLSRLIPQPGRIFNWLIRKGSRKAGLSGKFVRTSSIIVCGVIAWIITGYTPELHTSWAGLLGGCVVQGVLVHMLGDSVTESGICWRFPFVHPVSGRRWQASKIPSITIPRWVPVFKGRVFKPAFKTGRAFEVLVMCPLFFAGCLVTAPGGFETLTALIDAATAWRGARVRTTALPSPAWLTTPQATP